MAEELPVVHTPELASVADLLAHPRNYRGHPADQVEHLEQSIRENGFYRNVVVAKDGTILAGHGVVDAAKKIGLESIPVIRLDVAPDDPRALKILTGDNELMRLAEVDDRDLSLLLKEIRDTDLIGLLGTGFDDSMLTNLLMITRPASEIRDVDAAAEWVGLPEFEPSVDTITLTVHFDTDADRDALIEQLGVTITNKLRRAWSSRWPACDKNDVASLRFDG